MPRSLDVAVLASGSGTNFQALLDRFQADPGSAVRVTRLVASRPGIGAIDRAESVGVRTSVLPSEASVSDWLLQTLVEADVGLVVLAGWLKMIPPPVVERFRGRMINIHPALLPSFGGPGMYGRHVHEAVLQSGARVSGATVHFVDEIYDHGAIIGQWPVPVIEGDDASRLAARVLKVEHRILPDIVQAFAEGDFQLTADGRVRWNRPWYGGTAFDVTVHSTEE